MQKKHAYVHIPTWKLCTLRSSTVCDALVQTRSASSTPRPSLAFGEVSSAPLRQRRSTKVVENKALSCGRSLHVTRLSPPLCCTTPYEFGVLYVVPTLWCYRSSSRCWLAERRPVQKIVSTIELPRYSPTGMHHTGLLFCYYFHVKAKKKMPRAVHTKMVRKFANSLDPLQEAYGVTCIHNARNGRPVETEFRFVVGRN